MLVVLLLLVLHAAGRAAPPWPLTAAGMCGLAGSGSRATLPELLDSAAAALPIACHACHNQ